MNRVIVDYTKLTNEILTLLVERFPDGYDDSHIIRFRNSKNELIEAVEVRTDETIYLVKVSTKLADRIENYEEDDEIDTDIEPIELVKDPIIDIDEDDDAVNDNDEDDDDGYDKPDKDNGDDEDDTDKNDLPEDDDEDDED